ncbi:MAG: hypothetical protein ACE144_02695 [Thermodesulfobacteriota bacterium]
MNEEILVNLLNQGISLLLLIGLGFISYRGFKKNQALLTEREELLKRYLLFRGDKQIRLKIYGDEEKIRHELLKNISNSWKKFKKAYDECLLSLSKNTKKTQRLLYLVTLGLLINSAMHFLEAYFSLHLKSQFFYILVRELSNYILVILGLFLLRAQTHKFLSLRGEVVKVDREILFFPNSLSAQGEQQVLYNEFDPIEGAGEYDGKEDPNPRE